MRFADEEELETWYAEEKEKLDLSFEEVLGRSQDNSEAVLKKYEAQLKDLVARYKVHYEKFLSDFKK